MATLITDREPEDTDGIEFVNSTTAGHLLGYVPQTIQVKIRRGEIRANQLPSGRYRISMNEIKRLLRGRA